MDNIKKIFNKNNLKIIIPVIVFIVLLIVLIIYLREYKINNYRNKEDSLLYQYVTDSKLEYTSSISYNKNKVIKAFVPYEYNIKYDFTPIYFKEKDRVIFTNDMSIILPLKKVNQYKITEFTYIEKKGNVINLINDNYRKNIDHFIMYSGNGLYFFSDSVSFMLNGEVITLSALSYVIVKPDKFSYYDYDTDTYNIVSIDTSDVIVMYNDFYKLNISYSKIEYANSFTLLTNNFDYLSLLKEE